MNRLFYLLAITITSAVVISCGKSNSGQQQPGAQAIPVSTTKATKSPTVYFDKYPGTVNALQKTEIRSEVNGYVRNISFEEGTEVKKGKILYTIDQSKYLAARNQAEAQLKVAEANLAQAQQDADRYQKLDEKNAIAKQQVDMANTTLETAKQQVAAAKADLVRAQTDLNYSSINAPFDGIIGISNVRMGAYVVAGQTLLNVISSDNPMGVDFEINETEISRFLQLKNSKTILEDSSIYLIMPDHSRYPYPGKIAVVDRGINAQTGTIKIRLSFENPDDLLRDGMSVSVHVKNAHSGHNLIIPYKAVTEQLGEYFVFVVQDGKAQQIRVQTGRVLGDQVVVHEGLEEGQEIIIDGIQRLRSGMPVQVAQGQAGKPANGTAAK